MTVQSPLDFLHGILQNFTTATCGGTARFGATLPIVGGPRSPTRLTAPLLCCTGEGGHTRRSRCRSNCCSTRTSLTSLTPSRLPCCGCLVPLPISLSAVLLWPIVGCGHRSHKRRELRPLIAMVPWPILEGGQSSRTSFIVPRCSFVRSLTVSGRTSRLLSAGSSFSGMWLRTTIFWYAYCTVFDTFKSVIIYSRLAWRLIMLTEEHDGEEVHLFENDSRHPEELSRL